MRRLVALVALLAGCGSPELSVSFGLPPRYANAARSVSLRLLEPPPGQSFDCEALAFQDVDPALVRAATVFEQSAPASGGEPLALGALPRTSPKLFLARAIDAQGQDLAVGCGAIGEVNESATLELTAEPVVELIRPFVPPLSFQQGDTRTASVTVAVADRLGERVRGVRARWRIEAAGGEQGRGAPTSGADGALPIAFSPPSRPGPFLLSVRARWSTTVDIAFEGAVTPGKETVNIPGRVVTYASGAIGPLGQPGVAALVSQSAQYRVTLVYRTAGATTWTFRNSDPFLVGTVPRLVVLPAKRTGGPRDRVLVLSGTDWREVGAEGAVEQRTINAPAGAFGVAGAWAADRCGIPGAPQVLVEWDNEQLAMFEANAQSAPRHFLSGVAASPLAIGCVASPAGELLRTFVLLLQGARGIFVERPNDEYAATGWLTLDQGISMTPASGRGAPLLLGTQISLNDLVITRARLSPGGTTARALAIVPEANDAVPGFFAPERTVGGDIDGDGLLDVVSLLFDDRDGETNDKRQVWAILGVVASGRRLAGPLIGDLGALRSASLLVVDLDEDGVDDLVLGEQPSLGAAGSKLEIYRLGKR